MKAQGGGNRDLHLKRAIDFRRKNCMIVRASILGEPHESSLYQLFKAGYGNC
jgi:hypothetical protein